MAGSIPAGDLESGKTSNHGRHFKMKVLGSHQAKEIEPLIKGSPDPEAVVYSDKSTSYFNSENHLERRVTEKSSRQTTTGLLKMSSYGNK